MAKNAVSDWSTTAGSNSDIGGINIAEGCAPANINNAIREQMAQLATLYADLARLSGTQEITGDKDFTGAFSIGGVAVTATAAELNLLDGLTGVAGADLDILTGTAGTDGNLAQWNADGDLVDGPDVLDEDDFASNSASAVPTQQSVKAYVDAADAAFGLTSASGQYFQSAETSITSNGDISIAHGLSAKPRVIVGVLVCKTTDQGYAVGDEILIGGNSGGNTGITLAANATNIVGAFGTSIPVNAIGGTSGNITFGSWRLVVRAFL